MGELILPLIFKREKIMIDMEEIYKFKKELNAADAKKAIQKYAKQHGFKISKSNTSVKSMIETLLQMADEKENGIITSTIVKDIEKPESIDYGDVIETTKFVADIPTQEQIKKMNTIIPEISNDVYIEKIEPKDDNKPKAYVGTVSSLIDIKPECPISENMTMGYMHQVPQHFRPTTLMGRDIPYLNIPYWILDWIYQTGPLWKFSVNSYPKNDVGVLHNILYYISLHGKIVVRESRNSHFHHLS